jgi:nucleotide-binding universal stress UspA family protein
MFMKILVPLDGSALAEAVLPQVTELAKSLGAEMLLLRVAIAHVFPGADPTEEEVRVVRQAEEYVETLASKLAETGIRVRAAVRYGKPAAEIIEHIPANEVELVAMSTHGRSGLSRLVMGSVAEEVVRNSRVPVLLWRASGEAQEHL